MHWYDGSVAEAVTLSKQRNAIFVVFIEGDNDLSVKMLSTIDEAPVLSRLSNEANFLAIKLKSGSPNYTHFAQIYQFVPVPSLFFIGRNGTPLEVVCDGIQSQDLATRIDRILEEHNKGKLPGTQVKPSSSSQNVKEQTANFLLTEAPTTADVEPESELSPTPAKVVKTEHHEVTRSGQEFEVVCDGDVCVRRPKVAVDQPGPSHAPTPPASPEVLEDKPIQPTPSAIDIEEKMQRAKELIDARRREKEDKEKEQEKEKELERRQAGKGVAELKRWQADQELKQIQEERKREKMENNLARQRILEQIAQDRAERRARDAPQPQPQQSAPPPPTSGDVGSRARIQFKMPDGTSHTAHFDADGTLATVHRYVADNLQISASSFSLWTAFPRRELADSAATLRELELAPSAALLVMTSRQGPVIARPSAVAAVISFLTQLFTSMILEPSQQVYAWLRGRLFPPPARRPSRSPSPQQPPPPPGGPIRRRGNIHRLPSDRTSDDENNTWNGNSTQQM